MVLIRFIESVGNFGSGTLQAKAPPAARRVIMGVKPGS